MPEGRVPVVIVNGAAAMVKEIDADFVCTGLEESVTFTVTVTAVAAVGVPEITPVLVAIVNPAGRLPEVMDQV